MIGGPSNFQHLTHMDKSDATRVRNSKVCTLLGARSTILTVIFEQEMAEITAALKLPTEAHADKENVQLSESQQRTDRPESIGNMPSDRSHSPTAIAPATDGALRPKRASMSVSNAKRKAPPPVTQSIIKAAGLPAVQSTGAIPPVPDAAVVDRARARQPQAIVEEDRTADTSREPGLPSESEGGLTLPTTTDGLLPATNSFIQRTAISDIERLLVPGPDDLPTSSADTDYLAPALGAPMPAYVPPASGAVRSTTYQNLAISPSMENVLGAAVTVGGDEQKLEEEPAKEKRTGPLEYMTDTTKAKWDGQMEEIARQLREDTA